MSRPLVDVEQVEAVDLIVAGMLEAERAAEARAEFRRRAAIIAEAEGAGLLDYLTCPACRALVPIGPASTWPDSCPRCGRCV